MGIPSQHLEVKGAGSAGLMQLHFQTHCFLIIGKTLCMPTGSALTVLCRALLMPMLRALTDSSQSHALATASVPVLSAPKQIKGQRSGLEEVLTERGGGRRGYRGVTQLLARKGPPHPNHSGLQQKS